MRWHRFMLGLLLGLVLAVAPQAGAGQALELVDPAPRLDAERLHQNLLQLTQWSSRMTGTPGADAAADLLEDGFRSAGLEQVRRQSFAVTIPTGEPFALHVTLAAGPSLTADAYPLWPNGARLSGLPGGTLDAPLVYGGRGQLAELSGKEIEGAVVLLEFSSGTAWQHAFLLGARAVLFIEPQAAHRQQAEQKWLEVPADLPRFWVPRAAGEALREAVSTAGQAQVRLSGEVSWERSQGHNIMGYVAGTDANLRDEVVVIAAPYDAVSLVPELAPGAEQALSAAVLLELAHHFAQEPPRRSLFLLAASGHGQSMAGMRAFVEHQIHVHGSGPSSQAVGSIPAADPDDAGVVDLLGTDIRSVRFFELALTSQGERLGLFHRGDFYEQRHDFDAEDIQNRQQAFSPFGRYFTTAAAHVLAGGGAVSDVFVDAINPPRGASWNQLLPQRRAFAAEVVTLAGGTGLTFATVADPLPHVDTPHDQPARVMLDRVQNQGELLVRLMRSALDAPADVLPAPAGLDDHFHRFALTALGARGGSEAIWLGITRDQAPVAGVRGSFATLTPAGETVTMAGIPSSMWLNRLRLDAFGLEPGSGRLTMALDEGPLGEEIFSNPTHANQRVSSRSLPLFAAGALTLLGLPQRAAHDFVFTSGDGSLAAHALHLSGDRGVAFTPREGPRFVLEAPATGSQPYFRLSRASQEVPEGTGLASGTAGRVTQLPLDAAQDAWQFNAWRLQVLLDAGMAVPQLVQQHRMAEGLLARSREALSQRQYEAFLGDAVQAGRLAGDLRPQLDATVADAGRALLYYLILALPFAYFAARVFGAGLKRRSQLALAGVIFASIYGLLYLTHPAFRLGEGISPASLYGVLGLLVGLVAYYQWGGIIDRWVGGLKPQREGLSHTRPQPLALAVAAFNLGVENMARRKARSLLTGLTLLLLVVTLISIVSLQPHLAHEREELGGEPLYEGLLLRQSDGLPVPPSLAAALHQEYGEHLEFASRWWLQLPAGTLEVLDPLLVDAGAAGFEAPPLTAVGLAPQDPAVSQELLASGRWPAAGAGPEVLLPLSLLADLPEPAALLGTRVLLPGLSQPLVVSGILDDALWDRRQDLDGYGLGPVPAAAEHAAPGHATVLVTAQHLLDAGGSSYAVAGALRQGGQDEPTATLSALAAEILRSHPYPMAVGHAGARYRLEPARFAAREAAGPLGIIALIGALIVFNTMLGAVKEREDELRTYGSLGLAPTHVGALLMAEAFAFAVMGVGAGYLAAQLLSQGLAFTGILPGITLNVSSGQTLVVMAIVLMMVMSSTLYPSVLASRLSAPGYRRSWELSLVEPDRFQGMLPFYVSRGHELGLNIFLFQYLRQQMGEAWTDFHVSRLEVFPLTGEGAVPRAAGVQVGYGLECDVHLPPYDVGVIQQVRLETVSLGDDVYQVGYAIERRSGEVRAWQRGNRAFVRQLRHQYLLWNTLEKRVRDRYQGEGEAMMEREDRRIARREEKVGDGLPPEPLALHAAYETMAGGLGDARRPSQPAPRQARGTQRAGQHPEPRRARAYFSRPHRTRAGTTDLPGGRSGGAGASQTEAAQTPAAGARRSRVRASRVWRGGVVPAAARQPVGGDGAAADEGQTSALEPYEWRWRYRPGAGEAYGGGRRADASLRPLAGRHDVPRS